VLSCERVTTFPPSKQNAFPFLNWCELEHYCAWIRPKIQGAYIDRVIVPDRPRFPLGFLKGEWALRIEAKKESHVLICSVRAQKPSLHYQPGKGPKAAPEGTRSPFDLALSKHIRGARILDLRTLPKERIALLWLTAEGRSPDTERLALVLKLIPAQPEALLVKVKGPFESNQLPSSPWSILARSKTIRLEKADLFSLPDTSRAPPEMPIRASLLGEKGTQPDQYHSIIETHLQEEAWQERLQESQKRLRELLRHAETRSRQSTQSAQEAESEPTWKRWGDLLKAHLFAAPPIQWKGKPDQKGSTAFRKVTEWETEKQIEIPCDPKISDAQQQVEKFYTLARRQQRRLSEALERSASFQAQAQKIQESLQQVPSYPNWTELEAYEKSAGIHRKLTQSEAAAGKKTTGKSAFSSRSWSGKSFVSKEGFPIWVGKTKEENLELTFKHARGNDIWMHIKGRPGAHVVVPVPSGKSASLETLLDAAQLTLFYSGAQNWGKTEVDYTFKKHVKRIRDSSEASYTQNKTLIVQSDPERLKRLLG
jgi:predicted ribosome quality control (RQC) complex YloA/Tae2 family protein